MNDEYSINEILLVKNVLKALLYMLITIPVVLLPVLGILFLVTASPFFATARAFSKRGFRERTIGGITAGVIWGLILFTAVYVVEKSISIYPYTGMTSQHIMLAVTLCFVSALFSFLGARNPI